MRKIILEADTVIFNENDSANCMYLIQSGVVHIVKGYNTEKQHELAVLKNGEFFGEMGLIDKANRNATAVTESYTILKEITEEDFHTGLKEDKDMVETLLTALSNRIRKTDELYLDALSSISILEGNEPEEPNLLERFKNLFEKSKIYKKGNIAPHKAKTKFEPGEVIFNEGEKANFGYQLKSGEVRIYSDFALITEKLLATLKPGEFFGEMGALENQPRNATALAVGIVETEIYTREDILKKVSATYDGTLRLLRHESAKLKEINQKYRECLDVLEKYCKKYQPDPEEIEKIRMQILAYNDIMSNTGFFL